MLSVHLFVKLQLLHHSKNYFIRYCNSSVPLISKYASKKLIRIARKNMTPISEYNLLSPPENIRGLKTLDKTLFKKDIKVPIIDIGDVVISNVMPHLKKYILKMENLKPVQVKDDDKYVLLNPNYVSKWSDIENKDRDSLEGVNITDKNFKVIDFVLNYDNWRADELLKYILPDDKTSVAGFSKIGHIIHLNLRDHVMEYKEVIGKILLEKISGVRTVVNKLDKIDSTYRNFQMEILCGDTDMFVQVKENRCTYEFDFSTVYWNPRLSTEHERITQLLKAGDVLYDIFAGVGPFAIPASKKKCSVLANDLNPESYKWLNHNAKLNKVNVHLKTYNKDGRDFILNEVKEDLLIQLKEGKNIYITMNLPALATEFLNAFWGLFKTSELDDCPRNWPRVYVYCFAKGEDPEKIARELAEKGLGHKINDPSLEIYHVRKVSSYKEMMRVDFRLTYDILTGTSTIKRPLDDDVSNENKRLCHGEEQRETQGEKCFQSNGREKFEN